MNEGKERLEDYYSSASFDLYSDTGMEEVIGG